MMHLSVSIAIPTHNAAKWIDELLTNALTQSHVPAEIIVVDDGSRDNTIDIVERRIREGAGNIRLMKRDHASGGPAAPLNQAFSVALSPYIAICEQDDLMFPDRLARQLEFFRLAGDLGLITSYASIENFELSDQANVYEAAMDLVGLQAVEVSQFLHRVKGVNAHQMLASTKRWFMYSLSGCMVSKAAWESVGRFNEHYKVAADMDFILRLCERFDIGVISKPLYRFRLFPDHLYMREKIKGSEEAYRIWNCWAHSGPELLRESSRKRAISTSFDIAYQYRSRRKFGKSLAWYMRYYRSGGSFWLTTKGVVKSVMLLMRIASTETH